MADRLIATENDLPRAIEPRQVRVGERTAEILILDIEYVGGAADILSQPVHPVDQALESGDSLGRFRLVTVTEDPPGLVIAPALAFVGQRGLQLFQPIPRGVGDGQQVRSQCPHPVQIDVQRLPHSRQSPSSSAESVRILVDRTVKC
ncbi:hypothetical protein OIE68_09325 [Nocardia vinacea]|uniref:hypothetical protein n=1 Tax=Nocardia vinacea TaxID=96468 RepID=UPI002E142664|nr:hypothetical protein OIE68_09325 [Nocardia vinacea]